MVFGELAPASCPQTLCAPVEPPLIRVSLTATVMYSCFQFHASLAGESVVVLLDTGATDCFISADYALRAPGSYDGLCLNL